MKATVLLIHPPDGRVLQVPFGTLPVLTAALRAQGITTIQRDLSVEFFLQMLDPAPNDELIRRIETKLPLLEASWKRDRHAGVIAFLKNSREYLRKTIPQLRQLKSNLIADSQRGRFRHSSFTRASELYAHYLLLFDRLAIPSTTQNLFFERAADEAANPYYRLFDPFFDSVEWPNIVLAGITFERDNALAGLTLARRIKTRHPHVHIVLGGDLPSSTDLEDADDRGDLETILSDFADSIVIREGDTAIVKLTECVANQTALDQVPNLIWKDGGTLRINRPFICEDVGKLPPPDYDGLPVEYYPGLSVEISRGCYWQKCTFCGRNFPSDESRNQPDPDKQRPSYYRSFPFDQVVATINRLQREYHKDFFELTCLDVSPHEMQRLCRTIIATGTTIKWGARVRLDRSLKPELFDLMAEAGCYYYILHPETFSEHTMRLHNKNYHREHIVALINYWEANKHRLPPLIIVIMTGFPGETFEDFVETYRFIAQSTFDVLTWGIFQVGKKSQVYLNCGQYGLVRQKNKRRDFIFDHSDFTWRTEYAVERDKITAFIKEHPEVWKNVRWWQAKYDRLYVTEREAEALPATPNGAASD